MTTIIKSLLNICLIAATGVGNCEVRTPDDLGSTPRQPSLTITMALWTLGFADKQDSGNMWLVLLLIALTIDNQHSIFNIRVSFAFDFGCFYGQRRTNASIKVTYISLVTHLQSPRAVQTIQGPPFYQQVAGTVVLCDVTISLTNSYSDITDLDLNCRTLRDNTLPAATAEQLGELQQNMQFISKVGKTSL